MLLSGILKDTSHTHPDYQNLTQAVKIVKEVTDFVNDSIKSNQKVLQFTQLLGTFQKGERKRERERERERERLMSK